MQARVFSDQTTLSTRQHELDALSRALQAEHEHLETVTEQIQVRRITCTPCQDSLVCIENMQTRCDPMNSRLRDDLQACLCSCVVLLLCSVFTAGVGASA